MSDTWKVFILIMVVLFCISAILFGAYTIGYSYGSHDTEVRIHKEALDAGVAEIGPNPNAKSFFWKKP